MIIKYISYIPDYQNYSFDSRAEVIFSIDDNYYELNEDLAKLEDVEKMPSYIKNDWYYYNGLPLTEKNLDKHIRIHTGLLEKVSNDTDSTLETLSNLKSIKRNFRIDSIL